MKNHFAALGALLLLPLLCRAEVADSAANGFRMKVTLEIAAAPGDVYRALVQHVGDWWNPEHTYSGDSHNLSIEEKAGGCFCEKLPNQGAVKHLEVVYLAPGKGLVLAGGLGPLQSLGASGAMSIQLSPVAKEGDSGKPATKLEMTYSVSGYLAKGMNTWAEPVNAMLTEQFTRLKSYIEHGDPAPKK